MTLSVNLKTHTVKQNDIFLLINGKPQNGFQLSKEQVTFEKLETLYESYKYSLPDCQKHKYNYFRALPENKITTKQMILGVKRSKAKAKLEMTLLTGILNKSLQWPDATKWFWQSKKDKDFIILKEWFFPETTKKGETNNA